jgi:hypothetical protein
MKKILFPFYNSKTHQHLFSKKWFKFALIIFPILVIFITFKITMSFADNLYLYCYDDLQREQSKQTLEAARKINDLDFDNPSSELKALQIQRENSMWFDNKISECRSLADQYSVYMLPFGIGMLIISFYLIQFIFFRFVRKD